MNKNLPEEQISIQDLMTPHEHFLSGSTPADVTYDEQGFYTPIAISKGMDPERVKSARKKAENFQIFFSPVLMGRLAAAFEDLGEDFTTIRDPRIIGEIEKKTGKIIPHPERDLTEEFYGIYRSPEYEDFRKKIGFRLERPELRTQNEKESGHSSSPEKR